MARKKKGQPDRRGGRDNALFTACPGSFSYPDVVYEEEVVVLVYGWGRRKAMGRCSYCRKQLVILKNGTLPRHKRQHERGWDQD